MDVASLVIRVVNDGLDAANKGLQNLGQNAENAKGRVDNLNKNMEGLRNAALGAGAVLAGALGGAIKTAIDFEKAMAGVAKTIDFKSPDGLSDMKKGIEELTKSIPLAFEELAEIASIGGQLGVAEKDILGFTETIAKMGVAFDISAGEAADSMAKIAGIFQIPIANVGELGDTINAVSNSMAATAGDVIDFMRRVGGSSQALGIVADDVAALGGSMVALGMQPEIAGTAFNTMALELAKLDGAVQKTLDPFEALGLATKEFAELAEKDAVSAIMLVLEKANELGGKEGLAALDDAFGAQGMKIATMASGIDTVRFALDQVGVGADGVSKTLGSMQAEFESVSSTTANKLQLTKNNLRLVAAAVGEAFLPAVNELVASLIPLIEKVNAWASANPELVRQIFLISGAVTGFVLAVSGIGIVASSFLAMVTPVGMVVAAVASLVGIGVALYQNWDMIKTKADEVWSGIVSLVNDNKVAFAALSAVMTSIVIGFIAVNAQAIAATAVFTTMRIATIAYNAVFAVTNGLMAAWAGAKFVASLALIGARVVANTAVFIAHNAVLVFMRGAMLAWTATMAVGKFLALGAVVAANTAKIVIQSTALGVAKVATLAWGAAAKIAAVGANLLGAGIRFMLGPIGIAITVIGLLVTAGVYLYKNWDTVKAKANQVWSTVKTVIINSLKDLPAKLIKMGQDAVQGLINGIKSKIAGVKSAASELGQAAWGGVKSFLQIRSPSRKMAELGKNTAEGLAKGIKDNKKKPVSEAQKMAEQAVQAVKDTIANLKKEIVLFGNDDPLAEINYDISVGKYGGVAAQDLNQMKALTATAHAMKESEKSANAFKEAVKSLTNAIQQSGFVTELEKWFKSLSDVDNAISKISDSEKLEVLTKAADLDYSNLSKEIAKSNLEIDRQLELMGARTDLDKELLKIGYDLTDTMAQYSYYLETGQEARYNELEAIALANAEQQKGLAILKEQQRTSDAMNDMVGGLNEKSPLEKLQYEQDERLRIIQESMLAEGEMKQSHIDAMLAIDERYEQDLQKLKLAQYGDGLSLFTQFMGSMLGENKRAKRIMFALEKGFALATVLIENKKALAKAWSSAPFPYNLGVVASTAMQTGALAAAVQAISPKGFKQGGYTGSIGANNIAGVVHGNEYVFDAQSTKAIGVENLERIRRGKNTGEVNITVNNHSSAKVETKTDSQGNIIMTIRNEVERSWSNLQNANSHESKMIGRNFQAPRRRT